MALGSRGRQAGYPRRLQLSLKVHLPGKTALQ